MHRLTFHAAAHAAALFAGALVLAGCSEDGSGPKVNHPFKKVEATTASAKSPAEANYFETRKDGKTYVFSRVASVNAFREGRAPADTTTQQLDGKTVVFENRNYTDYNRLVAEYKKAHNVP
jgi:hypothetical protein